MKTLSLNLTGIDSEFAGYDSRAFIKNTDQAKIFDMAVYPTFRYYIDKVTSLNNQAGGNPIDKTKVLTIKTVGGKLMAMIKNTFSKGKDVYYISADEAKHEIEPTWRNIQAATNLKNYTSVKLEINNWSKIAYAYRIYTSYNLSVFEA